MAVNKLLNSTVYDATGNTKAVGYATYMVGGANATIQIAANSTGGNSAIGNPAATDFILGATITDLFWSTDSGTITIGRGSNTYIILSGQGEWNASKGWKGLQVDAAATINVAVSSANSTLFLGLKKVYS